MRFILYIHIYSSVNFISISCIEMFWQAYARMVKHSWTKLSCLYIFIGLWEHVWQECVLYVSFVQESKRLIHYVMTVSLWLTDSLSYTHSHSVWGREGLHNVFCSWTRLTGGAASVILGNFIVKSWIWEALNQQVLFSFAQSEVAQRCCTFFLLMLQPNIRKLV